MALEQIIIADDNTAIRKRMEEILAEDFEVVAAVADGADLVCSTLALRPDALVIDISMPVVTGLDALLILRRKGFNGAALIVSAFATEPYVRRAFRLGAVAFVLKSRCEEDLKSALRAALDGSIFLSPGIPQPSGLSPSGV